MKYKKIVSGLLACAMVVTSVFTGNVTTAKAAEQPTPVATYDFNNLKVSADDGVLGSNITAVQGNNKSLAVYTGNVDFVTGRSGKEGDKAVELKKNNAEYGYKLSKAGITTEYTVSFWVQPKAVPTDNQVVAVIGAPINTAEENWLGVAGGRGNKFKIWTKGKTVNTSHNWQVGDNSSNAEGLNLKQNEWNMLTITQKGQNATYYLDGQQIGTGTVDQVLNEGTQHEAIYLGVTHWDVPYACYIDDVSVYNQELTADQVKYLYLGTDDKSEILQNFTATETLELVEGQEGQIETTIPTGIEESEVTFSYQSKDATKATVDDNGKVTAVAAGTVKITTTATLANNGGTATKETTVTVKSKGDVLAEKGITVDKTMLLAEGEHQAIKVTLPQGLTKDDVTLTFASSDTAKATVDATGKVTAVAVGETDITTKAVSKSDTTKKAEATTKVTVRGAVQATVDYNFNDSALPADVEVVGKGAAASTATPAFDKGRKIGRAHV